MNILVLMLFVIPLSGEVMSCSQKDSCYCEKMKIFIDTASSFLKKAQDLNAEAIGEKNTLSCPSKPTDCAEILHCGHNKSGIYDIWPRSRITEDKIQVFCDMVTDGGGWTVFQRRGDYGRPKDFFYNEWSQYKSGFGKLAEDFWLGNDNIFALTNQRLQSLRIDMLMLDLEKNYRYAVYDNFWIDGEEYKYTLHVRGFIGNAGDSFSSHSGNKFSTKDNDNDKHDEGNCAAMYKGGWWYSKCHSSNLNGLYLNGTHSSYADGIEWSSWMGQNYSLPFVEMKIRPYSFSHPKN